MVVQEEAQHQVQEHSSPSLRIGNLRFYVSAVAICLKIGEGFRVFQAAPWDLPPSDYEQVWKVAGDQVQVAVLNVAEILYQNYSHRQEPSSNCNKFTQNVCTTVGYF